MVRGEKSWAVPTVRWEEGQGRFHSELGAKAVNRVIEGSWIGILGVTAALKLVTAVNTWAAPQALDPLLLIPGRWVLVLTVAVECLAVVALLWLRDGFSRGVVIAGLGWQFLLYQWAYRQFGGGCPCLGNVWRWTQTRPQSTEWISVALAAWLAVTGTARIVREWRRCPPVANSG